MSIAEKTRKAVRERPFLYDALRAGVLNYTEAARFLDVGDEDAVAAALRRYATELDDPALSGDARVRMESGLGVVSDGDGVLTVGETTFTPDSGSFTGIFATGELSVSGLRRVLGRCEIEGIEIEAVGFTNRSLALVVERRDGANALRIVEHAF